MSIAVMKDCINPASYGEICVNCNACGRFGGNSETIAKSKLYMLMRELKELTEKILNEDYDTLLQQKNITSSIRTISEKCNNIFIELGAAKEVPKGSWDGYGFDIKFSEWMQGGGQSE